MARFGWPGLVAVCAAGAASAQVAPIDAARAFYRHHGYTQAQLLPGYYGGRETSVRMVKDFGLSRTGAL